MAIVRTERAEDIPAIRVIIEKAFQQTEEADIVDSLRQSCDDAISLVAEDSGQVIGHLMFSPVELSSNDRRIVGMGLAPMAVLPERQRQGVGRQLVEAGISLLKERSCPFVIVLGHPKYYPRFGFEPASKYNLKCQWDDVPNEAFMALVFDPESLEGAQGVAKYKEEFAAAM